MAAPSDTKFQVNLKAGDALINLYAANPDELGREIEAQRSALDDRGDSLGAYDEAVAAAVETFEIGTLEVAQADDPFEQISSAPR